MALRQIKSSGFPVPFIWRVAMFVVFQYCFASELFAQQQDKINIQFETRTLKYVLSELTIITGYEFAYSDTEINSSRIISVSARQKTAEEIIQIVAQKARLEASFNAKKVILKPFKEVLSFHISGVVSD